MLQDAVERIKGVGEKTAALFHKMNIYTKEDLLEDFPISYLQYPKLCPISEAREKEWMAFSLVLLEDARVLRNTKLSMLQCSAGDESGKLLIQYFHASYLLKTLKKGRKLVFFGQVKSFRGHFILQQPKIFSLEEYEEKRKSLEPIYSLRKGLGNALRRKCIQEICKEEPEIPESFPRDFLEREGLCNKRQAMEYLHLPKREEERQEGLKRLAFEELFYYSLFLEKEERDFLSNSRQEERIPGKSAEFQQELPFSLTNAQKEALEEMDRVFSQGERLLRFVQGDVGSGKTILAFYALYLMASKGFQTAIMVPTEILAQQHFQKLQELLLKNQWEIPIALLIGSSSKKEKDRIYQGLKEGSILGVIGTQALIQEGLAFSKLKMLVIDEQHRFGIQERNRLEKKGQNPHCIYLSATPIPRSLVKLLYGAVPYLLLSEKPANRLPIKNALLSPGDREKAFSFIKKELDKGRQAYIICPLVEENENLSVESVTAYQKNLKQYFGKDYSFAVLHGKMKAGEKEQVMQDFSSGKTRILLSTTVVEVGVDVANATVMLIENAERFGLAQLHQLRGRVGRSELQSYCIFMDHKEDEKSQKRLSIIRDSNDGFAIAKEDLALRGPGDLFFGERQSGPLQFRFADPLRDEELFFKAREAAKTLLEEDALLERPEHQGMKEIFQSLLTESA